MRNKYNYEFNTRHYIIIKREKEYYVRLFKHKKSLRLRLNKAIIERYEQALFINTNS